MYTNITSSYISFAKEIFKSACICKQSKSKALSDISSVFENIFQQHVVGIADWRAKATFGYFLIR